jgi:hypothetical protein
MKRRPSEANRSGSADERAGEFLGRFFERHPRFFLYVGLGLGALALLALLLAKLTNADG